MPDSRSPLSLVEAEQARAAAALAVNPAQAHAALSGTPHTGGAFVAAPARLAERIRAVVGEGSCVPERTQLRPYEWDALTSFRVTPGLVALPAAAEEVVQVMKLAHAAGVPVVPRGSGTGLSGGALPVPGCVVLGLSRMKRILEIDFANGWMRGEPGVINLDVSKRIAPEGYYYAPDPSTQSVGSTGGNAADTSGAANCRKDAFTFTPAPSAQRVPPDASVRPRL